LKNRLAEEKLYLEDEITSQHDFKEIVGNSPAVRNVLQQIQAVAPTDATVLLLGEPRRDCRRAHSLRGWTHGTTQQVFP
jgi:transcriptional regulator with GAF, ATPase, and Fis domain